MDFSAESARLTAKRPDLVGDVALAIWGYAETGLTEFRSSAYLMDKLESLGFTLERGVGGFPTGFVAEKKCGAGGPTVGLLCEYDALPALADEAGSGNGHGCGHNLFAASAVATAAALADFIEENAISATVKLFGTPAEEIYGAKPFYVKQGIFDGLDVCIGFHPLEFNGVLYAQHNAITNRVYRFHGRSSHAGAEPHMGRSALDAAEIMNVAVNYMREHVEDDVRIHYIVTHGGESNNVVPAFAETSYGIRAQKLETVYETVERVNDCARAGALAAGCTVEIIEWETFANTIVNRPLAEIADKYLRAFGPPDFTEEEQAAVRAMGLSGLSTELRPLSPIQGAYTASTDEGDVSWQAPWIRVCMACLAEDTPGHSYLVTKQAASSSAIRGANHTVRVCTATLMELIADKDELARAKADYARRMRGRVYDRTHHVWPEPSLFPITPGVSLKGDAVAVDTAACPLIKKADAYNFAVLSGGEKLGEAHVTPGVATIPLCRAAREGEILSVYYTVSGMGKPALLSYLKA